MIRYGVLLAIVIIVALVVNGCTHNPIPPTNNIADPWPSANWAKVDSTGIKTLVVTRNGHIIYNGGYVSLDTGRTFQLLTMDNTHRGYHISMVVGPNGELYQNGYYSLDDGATWTNVPNNNYYLALAPNTPNHLYGTTANQLYLSTDNGLTWSTSTIPGGSASTALYAVTLSPGFDRLYVGTLSGFIQSSTNGQTWSAMKVIGDNLGIKTIAVLDGIDLVVATNNGELYRGTSSASVFTRIMVADSLNPIVYSVIKQGNYIYASEYGSGVKVSNDNGGTWKHINTNLGNMYVECLLYYGNYLFAGTSQGLYRTQITVQ